MIVIFDQRRGGRAGLEGATCQGKRTRTLPQDPDPQT